VQVDPIKPKLKPPVTQLLKLNSDEPLSNLAFKINLRRYNKVGAALYLRMFVVRFAKRFPQQHGRAVQVDPVKPMLKPPGTKHLKLKCDILLSTSAFRFHLRRYSTGSSARSLTPWRSASA